MCRPPLCASSFRNARWIGRGSKGQQGLVSVHPPRFPRSVAPKPTRQTQKGRGSGSEYCLCPETQQPGESGWNPRGRGPSKQATRPESVGPRHRGVGVRGRCRCVLIRYECVRRLGVGQEGVGKAGRGGVTMQTRRTPCALLRKQPQVSRRVHVSFVCVTRVHHGETRKVGHT